MLEAKAISSERNEKNSEEAKKNQQQISGAR